MYSSCTSQKKSFPRKLQNHEIHDVSSLLLIMLRKSESDILCPPRMKTW
uniref:Uncharacterized protein n=1 Tax=Schistosoma japonicum TaxID=6182 RepID=Q5BZ35_SCHJA|nr:unknown [Schistosoma japonicum]